MKLYPIWHSINSRCLALVSLNDSSLVGFFFTYDGACLVQWCEKIQVSPSITKQPLITRAKGLFIEKILIISDVLGISDVLFKCEKKGLRNINWYNDVCCTSRRWATQVSLMSPSCYFESRCISIAWPSDVLNFFIDKVHEIRLELIDNRFRFRKNILKTTRTWERFCAQS